MKYTKENFPLKVGDEIKLPKTKMGKSPEGTSVYKRAIRKKQFFLYLHKIEDNHVWLNEKSIKEAGRVVGDFYSFDEVELFNSSRSIELNYEIY